MRKGKWKLLLVALLAILVTYFSQTTLAYYTTVGKATNVVTSGDIQLVIHEKTADGSDFPAEGVYIIPGDVVSKQVTIENVCDHPFYLRLKVVSGIQGESLSADDLFQLDLDQTHWTIREDGYLYYNHILRPGEVTPAAFTQVEIVGDKVNLSHVGKTLTLTVCAYAVQSENNPAQNPWDAAGWPVD